MRTDWVGRDPLGNILAALTLQNRLACMVALETGLRISDVLQLRTEQLQRQSFTVTEQKTGKRKRCRLSAALRKQLLQVAGSKFVFEHRLDPNRHRTRQAVYADLRRAAKAFRLHMNVGTHSMRKAYAVDLYRRTGDLAKVKAALNHSHDIDTLLYALADELSKKSRPP